MPRGSMRKFFADVGGNQHGGALTWPGTVDGYPFRGNVPDMRQDEFQEIPLALDYKAQLFKLFDPVDAEAFANVMDRIVNGWYMQHKRIDRWSDDPCGPIVWLEWVQIYGESPAGKHPGLINDTSVIPSKSPPATPPSGNVQPG